jgi:hypothetical protein
MAPMAPMDRESLLRAIDAESRSEAIPLVAQAGEMHGRRDRREDAEKQTQETTYDALYRQLSFAEVM